MPKFWKTESIYDEPIAKVVTELQQYTPLDPEYPTLIKHLAELNELKEKSKRRISKDTLLICGANLLGIVVIVGYEYAHPNNSKGYNYVKQINP